MEVAKLPSDLPSSLPDSNLGKVQLFVSSPENPLKSEVDSGFLEELSLKEVEKIEAEHRCQALEKETRALKSRCAELEKEIECGEEIRRNLEEEKKRRVLLERTAEELQKEVLQWKKKHEEIALRLWILIEENSRLRTSLEQKPVVVITDRDNEDGESVAKYTISTPTPKRKRGLRIVSSDGEGEEEDLDRSPISKLKMTRGLGEKELDNEASDDLEVQNPYISPDDNKYETHLRRRLFRLRECSRKVEETKSHTPLGSPFEDQSPSMNNRRTSSSRTTVKKRPVFSSRDDDGDNYNDERTSGSESEGSLDDNKYETPPRRRLFRLRECSRKVEETKSRTPLGSPFEDQSPSMNNKTSSSRTAVKKRLVFSSRDDDGDNYNDEGTSGSESEGSSLGGFIVSVSDNSEGKVSSSHASKEESAGDEDESTSDENLNDILAKIYRRRDGNYNWEYEADMLASFAKDHRLCMEAVCALYRMQTADEKSEKETVILNKRGFNTGDAHRGSRIAEFLMDGDPECQLRKSVEELKMYDPTGPDYCHKLANRYSKQLFTIYKNKEDPFFPPS